MVILSHFFVSFIRSQLEYASEVWLHKKDIEKLRKENQLNATRVVMGRMAFV